MPATGTSQALLMAYEKAKKPVSTSQRWVSIVTALSTAAIIVSFLSSTCQTEAGHTSHTLAILDLLKPTSPYTPVEVSNRGFAFMGISLDTDPDWPGWIILDGICAIIFVAEVVVKSLAPWLSTENHGKWYLTTIDGSRGQDTFRVVAKTLSVSWFNKMVWHFNMFKNNYNIVSRHGPAGQDSVTGDKIDDAACH